MRKIVIVSMLVAPLWAGAALAQTTGQTATAPSAQTTAAPAKAAKPTAPRSAISLECSKQADAKGLHGKPRKTFRSQCKKDLAKKS